MRKRNWALLAVLLGMMVVVSGCFGGGGVRETGSIEGCITVNPIDAGITEPKIETVMYPKLVIGGDGLANATVKVAGISTKTRANGCFRLDRIPVGWHTLTVTHPQYKAYTSDRFLVEANKVADISQQIYGIGYYLIIGVQNYAKFFSDDYPDLINPRLKGPYNDIAMVQDLLIHENTLKTRLAIKMLDPTADQVIAQVERLAQGLRPRDYLVIYFSGHATGGPTNNPRLDALVCYDRFLTDGELLDALGHPDSEDITLILDGCFTGSFADDTITWPKAFRRTPYAVFTAAKPDSFAFEIEDDPEYGNVGLFTKHLVDAITTREADKNRDGSITVSEIYETIYWPIWNNTKSFTDGPQEIDLIRKANDPVIFKYR